ncbi:MAG: hypothetical protein WAN36_03405, partial [Calditrichia bacterium]
MRKWISIIAAVLLLFAIQALFAEGDNTPDQKIHPYLQNLLSAAPDNEKVPVYVVMKERLNLEDFSQLTRGLTRKDRRTVVVNRLKSYSAATQRQVRAYLSQAENRDQVENVRIIWAINVIAFRATPAVINDLAAFDEIGEVRYDAKYPIDELIDDNGIT